MSPRKQWLKMQRIMLRELKEHVQRLEGREPVTLSRYAQPYRSELKAYQKISHKQELLNAAVKADIIFGADFHAFSQSQRTHLRILRDLVKSRKEIILALEAIDSKHQKYIEKYLNKKISDAGFLKKIKYFEAWGFPWENYKVLFEFARLHKIKISGLNESRHDRNKNDLFKRDQHSARCLAELRKQNPKALIYAIYGDLHLAKPHLPKLTRNFLGLHDNARFLTIFQNSEHVYFKLARKRLEEKVDVVRLRPDAFCVVNSPPWLKWQAYLQFLETSVELEPAEHAQQYLNLLKDHLKLNQKFGDFQVYVRGDARILEWLSNKITKHELRLVEKLMRAHKSFFVPKGATLYLNRVGVNQISSLVGQFIHASLRRNKKWFVGFPKDLTANIWLHAVGFFICKLMNHRVKHDEIQDLPQKHKITLLVLEQRLKEEMALKTGQPLKIIRRRRGYHLADYFEVSKIMGALMGHKIYEAYKLGKLPLEKLKKWLAYPMYNEARFESFYMNILSEMRTIPGPYKSKNERL